MLYMSCSFQDSITSADTELSVTRSASPLRDVNPLFLHGVCATPTDLTTTGQLKYYTNYFTRGQFWPSAIVVACVCVCVSVCVCQSMCQSLACPRDNSGPVQARITKFGPKMQNTLVKVPIVLGVTDLELYGQI